PRNLYEQYVNAFAFSEMVKSQNTAPSKRELQQQAQSSWREIQTKNKNDIHSLISELLKTPIQPSSFNFSRKKTIVEHSISPPTSPNPPNIPNDTQFSINATELYEYNNLLRTATSSALHTQFSSKIKKLEGTIMVEESKIKSLKGNAAAQNRARERKRQKLDKENIVEIYDAP
ncbi:11088_t:CDS:2, partial [Rhizophagus irregularis]